MIWGVLLLGLLLRFPLLFQSLWLDEAIEALALQGHYGNLWGYSLSDFQPPLYHYLLSAWTHLFGFSELSLRFPSFLAGLLTIYLLVLLGTALGGKKVGVVAGVLAATNPLLMYYSAEGRTYALTALLVTASFYFFVHLTGRASIRSHPLPYLGYWLFTTLTLWTSYLSWLMVIAQGLYLLKVKNYRLLTLLALSTLTLLFWLPSFIDSLQIGLADARNVPGWGQVVGGTSLKALLLTWVKFNLGRISFTSPLIYASVVGALFAFHVFILKQIKSLPPWLLIWFALIPAALLVSLFVPAYSYTRILFTLPAYLLLLALGIAKLAPRFLVLYVLFNVGFIAHYYLNPRFHHEDWRGLTAYLNSQDQAVVYMPSLRQDPGLVYYGLSLPRSAYPTPPSAPRIFYLKYVEDAFDPGQLGPQSWVKAGYTITTQRVFSGLQLDLYEHRN